MKVEVGSFTYDTETETVAGPAEYMAERFPAVQDEIVRGRNAVFNYGSANVGLPGFAANVWTALLVAVQTDYAGWKGSRVFFARADAGLVPETGLPR